MFILWRYILKEHIGPFVFSLSVITLVFLLNLVFRELSRFLSRGLGLYLILEFFVLNIAWIIALAVPMAVLVATLMAFGRLSGDNEITAMKASGISIYKIISPVLLASVFCAMFLVWFNNHVLPDFNHRARLLASDIARKRPTLSLEPGIMFTDLDDYNILVTHLEETQDTSYVRDIFIEDNSEPNVSKIIFAETGQIYVNAPTEQLLMVLFAGEIHELDLGKMEEYKKLDFSKYRISIQVDNMFLERSESEYRGDREKSAQMLLQDVHEQEMIIKERSKKIDQVLESHLQKYLQSQAPPRFASANPGKTLSFLRNQNAPQSRLQRIINEHKNLQQQLSAELNVINYADKEKSVLLVEVHKKYSIPVACIVFILIGAPLGMMSRKGSLAVAGGISFGFFLLFWASLIGGEELADKQIISPFLAMWGADILVGLGGIYLLIHSVRESTFINWSSISHFFVQRFQRVR